MRVLDPACGSGNFLYVTLRLLKDLEHEAIRWGAERLRITGEFPQVGPHNVLGIETNAYAKELAGVAIWIGHIQWMLDHGYGFPHDPVLQPLDNIERRDAIVAYDNERVPIPATWPEAEFIVGNPPFLGTKLMRQSLGDAYVDDVFLAWKGQVARESDLACYWHEEARRQIVAGHTSRAGLLATNSIRGGANRLVLNGIKKSGDIFLAWSDEPWVVDGAAVRVSIVGQDDGSQEQRELDGKLVDAINSDLTAGLDLTQARILLENQGVSFMGDTKGGAFDIRGEVARGMLSLPANVNGRTNADVVVPWVNGMDITRRSRGMFIIDFDADTSESDAAAYEAPFEYLREHVHPIRATNKRELYRDPWWVHLRPRPAMRTELAQRSRFIVTPRVAKHRLFAWFSSPTLPDSATIAIARDDDYTFGVLHSRAHELWSLRVGTWLGVGNDPRYTPTTTFETFPFPWPINTPDATLTSEQRRHRDAIGEAARALDEARRRWLNPPEWVREEPDVLPSLPARLLPVDEDAAKQLRKRTLTNLYNARPTWLANLHATLDAAVFAAYGWPETLYDGALLERLLDLKLREGPSKRPQRHQIAAALGGARPVAARFGRTAPFVGVRRPAPGRGRGPTRSHTSPCGEARAGTRSVGWSGAGARSPSRGGAAPGTPRGRVGAGCTLPYGRRGGRLEARRPLTGGGARSLNGRRGAGWRPGGPWPAEVHAPLRGGAAPVHALSGGPAEVHAPLAGRRGTGTRSFGRNRRRCTLPLRGGAAPARALSGGPAEVHAPLAGRRGTGWRPGGPWSARVHAPLREARRRLEARRPLVGAGARSPCGEARRR